MTRLSSQARIGGGGFELGQMLVDVLRRGEAEDEAFEHRVGREAVGAVKARHGDLAGRVEALKVGAPVEVHHHPAAGIMRRRDDRDRLPGDVDADVGLGEARRDGREMLADEVRVACG